MPNRVPNGFALIVAALSMGCNSYDYFRLTGYVQEGFTNKADIVFVIDNSSSMREESDALAINFQGFIEEFASSTTDIPTNPDLTNDVTRFVDYLQDRAGNINFQMGVTTTEASADWGLLLGRKPIVSKTDDDAVERFNENLLCEAACVQTIPDEVTVDCGNRNPEGLRNCADSQTGAREEGIEAVFMAMCRAVEDPPEACFDAWWEDPVNPGSWTRTQPGEDVPPAPYFTEDDVLSNEGWLREGSVVIPVVVTDEGDQSRRIDTRDGKVFPYDEYFPQFGHRMSWAVIGASNVNGCDTSGAANWGVNRYRRLVNSTNGVYIDISVPDGNNGCQDADFAEALADIGGLLRALTSVYPLRTTPVPGTIVVKVGDESVPQSEVTYDEEIEADVYSAGWFYDASANTVTLYGDAVPDPNEDVRIWYLPGDAVPRDLPFRAAGAVDVDTF